MDRQDSPGGRAGAHDGLEQGLRGHQAGRGIDVGEDHLGAAEAGRRRRGQEGDGRNDADVAGPYVERRQRQVKRRRAARAGGRHGGACGGGQSRFEIADGRPVREPVAAQDADDGRDVGLVDRLPPVREERLGLRRFGRFRRALHSWPT